VPTVTSASSGRSYGEIHAGEIVKLASTRRSTSVSRAKASNHRVDRHLQSSSERVKMQRATLRRHRIALPRSTAPARHRCARPGRIQTLVHAEVACFALFVIAAVMLAFQS